MSDPRLKSALRDLETTATNFAARLIRMAEVHYASRMQNVFIAAAVTTASLL
ncbi:MAG: hypothetical protein IPK63_20975 [Candidatus Competibacteraceae bacterium]|nr:hypothetical protein [Candidatus Competibacteraceae bacterium]